MQVDFSKVAVIFRNELRMIVRDKRSVLVSVVLPLLLMPVMLFSSSWQMHRREAKLRASTCDFAVTGSESAFVRKLLDLVRSRHEAIEKTNPAGVFHLREIRRPDPFPALTNREVLLVLEGLSPKEAESMGTNVGPGLSGMLQRTPAALIRIAFRADRDDAAAAARRMDSELRQAREQFRGSLLASRGVGVVPDRLFAVTKEDLAPKGGATGLMLGRFLPLLLLFFMLMAGAMVASDLMAGEKERGTLETLLTSSAGRVEIVLAKQLVIFFVAIFITTLQSANLLIYAGFGLVPLAGGVTAAVSPGVALGLLVLFTPVAAVVAGVLLLTSGYAKTYKEAQLYFTPVLLLSLLPGLASVFPGLSLRSIVVLVPVANLALAVREVLTGTADWPMIGLAWVVTAAVAAGTLRLSVRVLSAERLVASVETDRVEFAGGAELFQRRVGVWFAVLWALVLIVSNYSGSSDLRLQLFLNLVVLFLGGPLLMVFKYRLDPIAVFALRLPKPGVWLPVIAAAPCGMLAGTGLFRLASYFLPVPQQMLEAFGQALLPKEIPFWQILVFMAVMPGVLEELTFRGVLMHGLHRQYHPVTVALVVGLVFGLFHMALFRLAPTAFLGALLAGVTLLTGSIFPAMLWHALNNALGLFAGEKGMPISDLPAAWYWFGAAGLVASFWILWRNRTPYPGLRTGRGKRASNNPAPRG